MLASLSYDPLVRIDLGPLEVSPHGILTAVGVLVGARMLLPAAHRRGITTEEVTDVLTWAVAGAIVGARLAYVVNHFGTYLDDPLAIVRIWEGGLSLLGGIGGGILAGYPRLRRLHIPIGRFADAAVPGLALGIAVGRIGDLIIADHLGKPTEFVLGYACPDVRTGSPCVAPGGAVHHTALYDMVGALAVLALLLWLRRRPRPEGWLTLVFAVGYGVVRFVEGFFRLDVTHGTGLNGSQWTAAATVAAALVALATMPRRERTKSLDQEREADAATGFGS